MKKLFMLIVSIVLLTSYVNAWETYHFDFEDGTPDETCDTGIFDGDNTSDYVLFSDDEAVSGNQSCYMFIPSGDQDTIFTETGARYLVPLQEYTAETSIYGHMSVKFKITDWTRYEDLGKDEIKGHRIDFTNDSATEESGDYEGQALGIFFDYDSVEGVRSYAAIGGPAESPSDYFLEENQQDWITDTDWHDFDMEIFHSRVGNGYIKLWQDGDLRIAEDLTTMATTATKIRPSSGICMKVWNNGLSNSGVIYVDEVYFSVAESYDSYTKDLNSTKLSNITTSNVTFT